MDTKARAGPTPRDWLLSRCFRRTGSTCARPAFLALVRKAAAIRRSRSFPLPVVVSATGPRGDTGDGSSCTISSAGLPGEETDSVPSSPPSWPSLPPPSMASARASTPRSIVRRAAGNSVPRTIMPAPMMSSPGPGRGVRTAPTAQIRPPPAPMPTRRACCAIVRRRGGFRVAATEG